MKANTRAVFEALVAVALATPASGAGAQEPPDLVVLGQPVTREEHDSMTGVSRRASPQQISDAISRLKAVLLTGALIVEIRDRNHPGHVIADRARAAEGIAKRINFSRLVAQITVTVNTGGRQETVCRRYYKYLKTNPLTRERTTDRGERWRRDQVKSIRGGGPNLLRSLLLYGEREQRYDGPKLGFIVVEYIVDGTVARLHSVTACSANDTPDRLAEDGQGRTTAIPNPVKHPL